MTDAATESGIRWSRSSNGLTIHISARRNWFARIFCGFVLVFWTYAGIQYWIQFYQSFAEDRAANEMLFVSVWLVGWAAGWLYVAVICAWLWAGFQRITVNRRRLQISDGVFIVARNRSFDMAGISNLEINPGAEQKTPIIPVLVPILLGRDVGRLRFDHGYRTHTFGPALNLAEGQQVLDLLKKAVPEKFRLERA
ncbi:hypothetical protein ACKTEK_08085 [Tepidamorphus sp. 3E244]|uniref:hypothetical protein n=1 Tax=Tepidamorphus sp. 3E244 TaxID=3385498 RepID=UPI0038FC3F59